MRSYTFDFETTTDPEDCRVWAYGIYSIDDDRYITDGNSIEGFIEWCECAANCKGYFHNLGFDGVFIIDHLLKSGWLWVDSKQKATDRTFTTLISDMNQVYQITLYFTKTRYVTIQDSLKIIPLSVEAMAKAYGLGIGKGSIDYDEDREPGHEITDDERAYLVNDVAIVAKSLRTFFEQKLTKMTAGSNALFDYKRGLGGHRKFRNVFPLLSEEEDAFIRKAYRGGFAYVSPKFQGRDVGEGIVFDVNSLYPSVMAACDGQFLPYGKPVWFDGAPQPTERHPLWIACVLCSFKVRKEHIPCLQLKGNMMFKQTEYVEDSRACVHHCHQCRLGTHEQAVPCLGCGVHRRVHVPRITPYVSGLRMQVGGYKEPGDYIGEWWASFIGETDAEQLVRQICNTDYGKIAQTCVG